MNDFQTKLVTGELVPYGKDKYGNPLYRSKEAAEAEANLAKFHGVPVKQSCPAPPSNVGGMVAVISDQSAN